MRHKMIMRRFAFLLPLLLAALAVGGMAQPVQAQSPLSVLTGGSSNSSGGASASDAPLKQLLDVLKDDNARQKLIDELEKATSGNADTAGQEPASKPMAEDLRSFGAQIADFTQQTAIGVKNSSSHLGAQIVETVRVLGSISPTDFDFIVWLAARISALIFITYGGLWLMRVITDKLRQRLKLTIRYEGWLAKTIAVTATLIVDVINMGVPWAVGYICAFVLLDPQGEISFAQSLYLNAFAVLEIGMAILRSVLAPNRDEARLVPLGGAAAGVVLRWCRLIGIFLIYGQLMLLPLMVNNIPFAEGRAIALMGLFVVLALLAAAVWRAHRFVTAAILDMVGERRGWRNLARYWHIPVLLYLAVLFIVALARPLDGFYRVLLDNAEGAAAILAGIIIINLLTRAIGAGVRLPAGWRQSLPSLERQINAFVPQVLKLVRFVVIIGVIAYCGHVLGLYDMVLFLESDLGNRMVWSGLSIAFLLLAGFSIWLVLNAWVEFRIGINEVPNVSARERTLLALLRNAVTITLIVIMLMFVLSELGLNIAPLLASAGVIGLAIGFGAQKLVQDIITGIFIQLEGAIDVGDVVSIGGISGVVERLTIRSAALRDLEGRYHVVPFSSVDTVTNFMREFSYALMDIGVAYREDVEDAKQAIYDAFEDLKQDPELKDAILDELEWMGLNSFEASEIILRSRIKTRPGMQWQTKRAFNAVIKRIFDERGIEIPFPHHTLYFGTDKKGEAPPAHVVTAPLGTETAEPPNPQPGNTPVPPSQPEPEPEDQSGKTMPDPDAGPDT